MTISVDAVVVGAGVVGLAVARELQKPGRQVLLVERETQFGMGASSRNSEVIHAGIYYRPGSLKARLCVAGRHLLYDYCAARSVPHRRIGKIIVAVEEDERAVLDRYAETARANGVDDLAMLDGSQVRALEPEVLAVAGLLSPSTGIVDSHALMAALLQDFEAAGGIWLRGTAVLGAAVEGAGFRLRLDDAEGTCVTTPRLVNAAGLDAPGFARGMEGFPTAHVPAAHYAVGQYFRLSGRSPFRRLVYPVAPAGGLGVHVTLDMAGAARFGPDVRWIDGIDYRFDEGRKAAFVEAIRRYWPGLDAGRLEPGYTGIRPKIVGPGEPDEDFLIQGPEVHGVPGLVNLFGIESPGLTAALAIGEFVTRVMGSYTVRPD